MNIEEKWTLNEQTNEENETEKEKICYCKEHIMCANCFVRLFTQ